MDRLISEQKVLNELEVLYLGDLTNRQKIIDRIKSIPSADKWIPVSERLPEEYKEVIVTDIETSDTYLSRYIGNGCWECDNGLFNNRIIAWQPKPQPYKAESEEISDHNLKMWEDIYAEEKRREGEDKE